jgi:hypothetical protein
MYKCYIIVNPLVGKQEEPFRKHHMQGIQTNLFVNCETEYNISPPTQEWMSPSREELNDQALETKPVMRVLTD